MLAAPGLVGVAVLATFLQQIAPPQADIRVQSLELVRNPDRNVTARVVVTSDNNSVARAARLELFLPVGVVVTQLGVGCHAVSVAGPSATARVSCDLGDLPVRGVKSVALTTTTVPGGMPHRIAVFVESDTPDPIPTNNYSERILQ